MRQSILIGGLFAALLGAVIIVIELVRIPNLYEVEGSASITYRPDAAHVSVGAYFESEISSDAISTTATTMHNILDALKTIGIEDKDVVTKGIESGPKTQNGYGSYPSAASRSPEPEKPGFYADQVVTITVHDLSRLAKLLDTITASGSNSWRIEFFASDPETLMTQAHRAAFADAMRRANLYATDGGFKRGAVLKITEGNTAFPQPDYYNRDYPNTYASSKVEKVTVTGSRLPVLRGFAVPAPAEQTVTATAAVIFEIR